MRNKIFLSDYCSAIIETGNELGSQKPYITFDFSDKIEDDYKIKPNTIPIYNFNWFHASDNYDEHLSLISNDKIKELIISFCEANIKNCKESEFFDVMFKRCNKTFFRDSLLELFEELCWNSFE